mmetsp:Transcript_41778/g.100628  ORF Transcript_41778/g.100628 Transcript_41778/m.100628 type:complete len:98 (+) Transcript_41778:1529-1822(+)
MSRLWTPHSFPRSNRSLLLHSSQGGSAVVSDDDRDTGLCRMECPCQQLLSDQTNDTNSCAESELAIGSLFLRSTGAIESNIQPTSVYNKRRKVPDQL